MVGVAILVLMISVSYRKYHDIVIIVYILNECSIRVLWLLSSELHSAWSLEMADMHDESNGTINIDLSTTAVASYLDAPNHSHIIIIHTIL